MDADQELILTPGTQGALFLAMGANIAHGDKVAIVEPDYFANRKLVTFFEGELVPVGLDYFGAQGKAAGLDLNRLEAIFADGVKLFIFSNPNNPTGVIYTAEEIRAIGELAAKYHVKVICDELYSRQIFDGRTYTHLRSLQVMDNEDLVTIIGPSKTESMSGFRLGAAFGSRSMIQRMEKLQAIVSLRAAGYCQAVTAGGSTNRKVEGGACSCASLPGDILATFAKIPGVRVRPAEGGSYLFPQLPPLTLSLQEFIGALRSQAHVIVTPGTEFGPQYTDSFRINFSQDHDAAVAAVERIGQMIERYRAPKESEVKA